MTQTARFRAVGSVGVPAPIACVLTAALAVFLRVFALSSDAYPRLSWSSALLTDEGFYIHNARNVVLYGRFQTDQFNNALIMPLLHGVQVVVFRIFGVGTVPARSISVVAGLLTAALLYDAIAVVWNRRASALAALFLCLDHSVFLYNRLALMDTPAALLMTAAFWAFCRAVGGRRHVPALLTACGVFMVAAFATRGLAALLFPLPLAAIKYGERRSLKPVLWYAAGFGVAFGLYLVLWSWPHAAEIARVNRYYIHGQLLPHSVAGLWHNLRQNLTGESRGLAPYLWRHTPVWMALSLAWILGSGFTRGTRAQRVCGTFVAGWILLFWLFCSVVSYSPSRYYVLFYPALAAASAISLCGCGAAIRAVLRSRGARALIVSLSVFLSLLPFCGGQTLVPGLAAMALALLAAARWANPVDARTKLFRISVAVWALVNLGWSIDWMTHLSFRQQAAGTWLARHLPEGSVLIGAIAPGLCMDNRFIAVNVIDRLCNFDRPVERFAGRPRYIIILDDRWKERWWSKSYPDLTNPANRLHEFRGLLRPFFVIGLYPAGDADRKAVLGGPG